MVYGVLLAGGSGTRLGLPTPKQFLKLGTQTLLEISLDKFLACEHFKSIVVVVPGKWSEQSQKILEKYDLNSVQICIGGKSRQESLYHGLVALKNQFDISDNDIVVTHDVARPFVTLRMIEDNIKICRKCGAADTVVPVVDTIVRSLNKENIHSVPVRSELYLGRTPQTFYINQFISIYQTLTDAYLENVTDAARILIDHGVNVGLVDGDYSNLKVTTQFDLAVAKMLMSLE